jgi:hypothetical protein
MRVFSRLAFCGLALAGIVASTGALAQPAAPLPCTPADPNCYIQPFHMRAERPGRGVSIFIPPFEQRHNKGGFDVQYDSVARHSG